VELKGQKLSFPSLDEQDVEINLKKIDKLETSKMSLLCTKMVIVQ